ncbi:hypothetical protein RchiOBHm_Chr5g0003471 [Rosa chinensis]|uniref:Uncharacterized protein n=1 Tax=Rosa chinensis TaxID=74649 RepID=A0A2P6Q2R3_ROSCH|nr:hypothetical protein RchiOBHm_Chr5g0003471 [Rosa chinensis]
MEIEAPTFLRSLIVQLQKFWMGRRELRMKLGNWDTASTQKVRIRKKSFKKSCRQESSR